MKPRIIAAALSGTFVLSAAHARQEILPQSEWAQEYAAPAALAVTRSASSVLSPDTLASTERAVESYRGIVERGGWQPVRGVEGLKVGARGPEVLALRARLEAGGDLDARLAGYPVYDSYVQAGVRRFQARHGLNQTGVMNAATARAMNVTAATRLRQLETNVLRIRSYSGELGRRHVVVNIPAALMETVQDGQVFSRHAAGVGKADRQSPILNAKAVEVNLNPFWTAPASIIRKDLIPKMQRDPGYLKRAHIRIFDGEREIQSEQVNWQTDEATRYRFRQDPGASSNAMGFVRVNIPNQYGVFMHDTPDKGVYADDFRFVSSGCVRVQNVRGYVAWLLAETPGWGPEAIERVIASGERVDAKLSQPVPVYWVYVTAWATPDGTAQFRDDIYGKDGLDAPAMSTAAPVPDQRAAASGPAAVQYPVITYPARPAAPSETSPAPQPAYQSTAVPAVPPQRRREAMPAGALDERPPVPPGDVGAGADLED